MRIADSEGISINYKFSFLEEGLWDTLCSLSNPAKPPVMLDQTDLQLLLYSSITELTPGKSRVKPLLDYLGSAGEPGSPAYEKRAWQLSLLLSRYFLEYEYYREEMITYWLSGQLAL